MAIIVIGGGIGGLAAGLAVQRAGRAVVVCEQAAGPAETGAGIMLAANACRVLERLGVAAALAARGCGGDDLVLRDRHGRTLASTAALGLPVVLRRHLMLQRGDLQAVLAGALAPGTLQFGRRLTEVVRDGARVVARFAAGDELVGEALVGADGLHSRVRSGLHGSHPPRYAGYLAWRGVCSYPGLVSPGESWGRGQRFGMMPIGGGRVYWFATLSAPVDHPDQVTRRGDELLERFADWHAPIAGLIRATAPTAILRHPIYDRPPLAQWGAGPVTLLGDAAHPMTPDLGQGACQALEDAVELAARLVARADPAAAFAAYEAARRPRTAAVQLAARRSGAIAQWRGPLSCWLRDRGIAAGARWLVPRQLRWLAGYDPAHAPGTTIA